MSREGFELTNSEADADIIIYNSCAVKGPTENRIVDALKRIPSTKKVVVSGCLPLISFERLLREVRFDAAIGTAVGEGIVDVVNRISRGEKVVELDKTLMSMPDLDLPRVQTNPIVSVVPVSYGCLGSCAYCCVVQARGHLRSYLIDDVTKRVERDVNAGVREIWVTSQDTACYGKEIGTNLATLIKQVANVKGDFWVRVGMMTPNMILPFLGELIEAFKSEKVFKFVHLPVQSGDNDVLRRMRRFYTIQEFKNTITAFRDAFPQVTLSTDVICGFPGESIEAFENTLQLVSEIQPDVVNVSKFFARPKTAAWDMLSIAIEKGEIKRRSTQAAALARKISLRRNQQWLGWGGQILIDEKGKVAGSWVGRNFAYKPIAVKAPENLLGKKVHVRVVKVFFTHLEGVIE